MKTLLLSLVFLSFPLFSFAQDIGNTCDFRSGNLYQWNSDIIGNTGVKGYNYHSGSLWNTTIDNSATMKGMAPPVNYWNYNSNTGLNNNMGTGRSCYGYGNFKSCYP
jgi:hypothetical protein